MPGAPISTACVEGGRAAGLGRAGGEGGTEIVSLAAEARTAALSSDSREGICMAKAKGCELQPQNCNPKMLAEKKRPVVFCW